MRQNRNILFYSICLCLIQNLQDFHSAGGEMLQVLKRMRGIAKAKNNVTGGKSYGAGSCRKGK